MKTIITILLILIVGESSCHKKAQPTVKYWMYTVTFTVEGGCTSFCTGTTNDASFPDIAKSVAGWVYPDKLTAMHITRMTDIPRAQMFTKGTPYKCEPYTSLEFALSYGGIAADSIHFIYVGTPSRHDLSNHSEITKETLIH